MKLPEIIADARTVAIAGHVRPDGDCVGSALAIYNYIKKSMPDVKADIFLTEKDPKFSLLAGFDEIIADPAPDVEYDLFISLDVSAVERLGKNLSCFKKAKRTFCIDHHVSNVGFADGNYIIASASSACEVLYDLLDPELIDETIAAPLYMGMAHDSGMFRFSSTSSNTMRIAGEMMDKGIDFSRIIEETYFDNTYAQNQITGRILMESIIFMDGKCIAGRADRKMMNFYRVDTSDMGGVIDSLRNTRGIECAIFMYQLKDLEYKVSLRSKSTIDVNKIALKFGGGGHKRAAGFEAEGTFYDILNNISEEIEKQFKKEEGLRAE